MRGVMVLLLVLGASGFLYWLFFSPGFESAAPPANEVGPSLTNSRDGQPADELRSSHWVGSTPVGGAELNRLPALVQVRFNRPLQPHSTLTVARQDQTVSRPEVTFSQDQLAMEVVVADEAQSESYGVEYQACFLAEECSRGRFRFTVRPQE